MNRLYSSGPAITRHYSEGNNVERKDWTQEHCQDCGLRLDPFGICPLATEADAATMTAPVGCGLSKPFADAFISALVKEWIAPQA